MFYMFCNNRSDVLLQTRLIYHSLSSRGFEFNLLRKSFMKFCRRYDVGCKYGETKYAFASS